MKQERIIIEGRQDKDRVLCPYCHGFVAEIHPRLGYGQKLVVRCPRCKKEVTMTKERK